MYEYKILLIQLWVVFLFSFFSPSKVKIIALSAIIHSLLKAIFYKELDIFKKI